jgi:hypothetical protein
MFESENDLHEKMVNKAEQIIPGPKIIKLKLETRLNLKHLIG